MASRPWVPGQHGAYILQQNGMDVGDTPFAATSGRHIGTTAQAAGQYIGALLS